MKAGSGKFAAITAPGCIVRFDIGADMVKAIRDERSRAAEVRSILAM